MDYRHILVTGGSGFIGSNYIRHILSDFEDVSVVNLDSLTYAAQRINTIDLENDKRYTFERADVTDREALKRIFERYSFDAIVHFAAESSVDRSFLYPEIFEMTNVEGTKILLDAVCSYNRGARFLYISTDEVYGECKSGSFNELSPLNPMNPYSVSKKRAEDEVLSASGVIDAVITRSTNNYGIGQYPEKLIPLAVKKLVNGERFPVYGDGGQIRDWLYAPDNCRAITTVLRKGEGGSIYNIGAGDERTNLSVLEEIIKILGVDRTLLYYTEDRAVTESRYSVDSSRIKALGWQASTPFEKGIRETVLYCKALYER